MAGNLIETRTPVDVFQSPKREIRDTHVLDLTLPAHEAEIAHDIRNPLGPSVIHFGTPTGSFATERAGSTRCSWSPGGRGVSPDEAKANRLVEVTGRLAQLADEHNKTFTVSAPARNLVWLMPAFLRLAAIPHVNAAVVDLTAW